MPVASIFFSYIFSIVFAISCQQPEKYGNSFPYYKEEKRHIHTKSRISTRFFQRFALRAINAHSLP